MRDDERASADEWTAEEKLRVDSLSRERVPSDLLKTRTVSELRTRGLVRHHPASRISLAWVAVAASLVFVAGGLVGYRVALTRFQAQMRLAVAESARQDRSPTVEHVVWF